MVINLLLTTNRISSHMVSKENKENRTHIEKAPEDILVALKDSYLGNGYQKRKDRHGTEFPRVQ